VIVWNPEKNLKLPELVVQEEAEISFLLLDQVRSNVEQTVNQNHVHFVALMNGTQTFPEEKLFVLIVALSQNRI
jgi:uncharacterized protein YchJ